MFRALAARCKYLPLDRPDIAFAAKELCREVASPSRTRVVKLNKLVRYLAKCPRLILRFDYNDESAIWIDLTKCRYLWLMGSVAEPKQGEGAPGEGLARGALEDNAEERAV